MQLESVMSMMRYSPPNGTAGFARSRVSGHNRSPCPPASSTPMASFISDMADPRNAWRSRGTFYQQNRSKTQHLPGQAVGQFPVTRIIGSWLYSCIVRVPPFAARVTLRGDSESMLPAVCRQEEGV